METNHIPFSSLSKTLHSLFTTNRFPDFPSSAFALYIITTTTTPDDDSDNGGGEVVK